MRWLIAFLAFLIGNPASASLVGQDIWDDSNDIGFVPLSITNALTGEAGNKSFTSIQNFGNQEVGVSAPVDGFPPGVINFTPSLVFRVSAFGSALPAPNYENTGVSRNGFLSATFSGTYKLFNNHILVDTQSFNASTSLLGSGTCVVECTFDAYQLEVYGPGVTVPTDEASSLNLVMQFSDLTGTLNFDDAAGFTTFVHFTSVYDLRMFQDFFFGPAPDPVSQIPVPSTLLLLLSALFALVVMKRFISSRASA